MKRLLIIGHGVPEPQSTGAGVRMMQLIQLFKDDDFDLHFCSTAAPIQLEHLQALNVAYRQIELNSDTFNKYLQAVKPTVVVFDRFITQEQYAWRVKEICPEALLILDTEDLHFLRAAREKQEGLEPNLILSDQAKRELAAIYLSDLSLLISKQEMAYLENLFKVPQMQLLYLPFLVKELPKLHELPDFNNRKDFCFVGTGMHKPNLDAIRTLNKLWPSIKKEVPLAELKIYGAYLPDWVKQMHNPKIGFLVIGQVPAIQNVLKTHKLLLAPLSFGAGQKRKIFDAWQAGCPVITSPVGAEGIAVKADFAGKIVDSEGEFVAQAVNLYKTQAAWKHEVAKIESTLKNHYSWDTFAKIFKTELEARLQNPSAYQKQNPVGQILWYQSFQSSKYLSKWIAEKNKS